MSDHLRTTLKKLRLSGLAQSLEVRLHEAAASGLNHREFLELLLQDELLIRNQRLIGRRTATANFREMRRLEDFDFSFNSTIKKNRIFDLATCGIHSRASRQLLVGRVRQAPARVICAWRLRDWRRSVADSWCFIVRSSTRSATSSTTKPSPARNVFCNAI